MMKMERAEIFMLTPTTIRACLTEARRGNTNAQHCLDALRLSLKTIFDGKDVLHCMCPECHRDFNREHMPLVFVIAVPLFPDPEGMDMLAWGVCEDCFDAASEFEASVVEWLTLSGVDVAISRTQ